MDWQEAQKSWLLSLAAEQRSPNTIDGYRSHLVPFNRWLEGEGITTVEDIGPFHIRAYLVHYAQNHSPHSVRTVYGTLRAWLRWLVSDGALKTSPTDKVKPPTTPEASKRVYTPGELMAIRKHLEKSRTPLGLRDYALVCLLMDTGARCSETLSATIDDIQDGCLLLRQTKGKRPRMVPLGRTAEKALWHYIQRGRPKLRPKGKEVFLSDEGRQMTRNGVRCVLRRLGEALGFPVSAHRFRHTWATIMLRKGADFETLRRLGGWTDYAMLRTYSHLAVEDLKKTQERLSIVDGM